jgi:hypothetical protein
LVLSLMLGSMAFVVPSAEAKTTAVSSMAAPQIRVQIGSRNRRNRNGRSEIRTRVVQHRNGTFRETYRITYFGGRRREQLISRVRISR